ncbi:RNA polymerase subunit sigma-54 [Poseidonocella sp. HB161398]|uniref:RNA polymerase factor sigma-54 n=1 Tax=Poseidonocella sp. HB161398 TaxID=2320855 RepID=UPI001108735C|nr:RNA polymerase subunit sigma-54 [Poseidonocella sp. HB161398]
MAVALAHQQGLRQGFALRLSVSLLALPAAELEAHLAALAAANPLLVLARPRAGRWSGQGASDRLEAMAAEAQPSLIAHVMQELHGLLARDGPEARLVLALIGELEPTGWLGRAPGEIARELGESAETAEAVLRKVQRMASPAGLFARSLGECLALQLEEEGALDPQMRAVLGNLGELETGGPRALARRAGIGEEVLAACLARLRRLDPKPGARFQDDPVPMRPPDAVVALGPEGPELAFGQEAQPRVRVAALPPGPRSPEMAAALKEARAVCQALELRQGALREVIAALVSMQKDYFRDGRAALRPLRLADIAAATGFHASTVSRVLNGFLIEGPQGIVAARDLLCGAVSKSGSGCSSARVGARIAEILRREDPAAPVSDTRLAELLAAEGIEVSRRMAARYRARSGFASAASRRLRA